MEALGEHTAKKFLEAKKKELGEYEEVCGGDAEVQKAKITDWEIKKYL